MKNLILPAFVMLIGAGTAFASGTAEKSSKAAPIDGYIHNQVTGQCEVEGKCDNTGTQICTVGNVNPDTNPSAARLYDSECINLLFQVARP